MPPEGRNASLGLHLSNARTQRQQHARGAPVLPGATLGGERSPHPEAAPLARLAVDFRRRPASKLPSFPGILHRPSSTRLSSIVNPLSSSP